MKRPLYILIILICFNSCQTDKVQTVEGDLYFKLIDFPIFLDAPDSILVKFEKSVITVDKDTLKKQDKELYEFLEFMIDENLLRKPFIRLRLDNGEVKMLFLDSSDYRQFKHYNFSDLERDNKKIRIKASITELHYDTLTEFNTIKILSVEKIDGKTYWRK